MASVNGDVTMHTTLVIPERLRDIYPNGVRSLSGTPAVIFRDHRWTLPVIQLAADEGLVTIPATVVTLDRHEDAIAPAADSLDTLRGYASGECGEGPDTLADIVRDVLSPRDDDWIGAGKELGVLGDVVQFRSGPRDDARGPGRDGDAVHEGIPPTIAGTGAPGRFIQLGRPSEELGWKGALGDAGHGSVAAGLWDILGWDPSAGTVRPGPGGLVLDIDLDFFTIGWERYILPFDGAVFYGEFDEPRQSAHYRGYTPGEFMRTLAAAASVVTIATEPAFCGGADNARRLLDYMAGRVFGGALDTDGCEVDHPPAYPDM